ncbi:hypothetical protein GQ42DRAFT_171651 [Ramicandelaber brevisporus]|nr:hypothetical protein GQ42DRAFT_171651 [Ramicandelaber brevisporus]
MDAGANQSGLVEDILIASTTGNIDVEEGIAPNDNASEQDDVDEHDSDWDDSMLVDAWKIAMEQYQRHHGVRWTLSEAEKTAISSKRRRFDEPDNEPNNEDEDGDENGGEEEYHNEEAVYRDGNNAETYPLHQMPPMPAATGNAEQDALLRNICNAWYSVGYHTGVYHQWLRQQPQPYDPAQTGETRSSSEQQQTTSMGY